MGFFPVCLDVAGRKCVVIGGGRVAERKVGQLLECGAVVRVISPELTPRLRGMAEQGVIGWEARPYARGDLAGAFLVIAATDDEAVQEEVHGEAVERNLLLNVADVPKWCNFILPATLRRGDFMVSVSTAGKSPALASKVRKELETVFGEEYGVVVELLGHVRAMVLERGGDPTENKELFTRLTAPDLAGWIRGGDWEGLRRHLAALLGEQEAVELVEGLRRRWQEERNTAAGLRFSTNG